MGLKQAVCYSLFEAAKVLGEKHPQEKTQKPLIVYVQLPRRRKNSQTLVTPKKTQSQTFPRRLPSKTEILQHATELYHEFQLRGGLEATNPEEDELRELGLIQKAQAELMTGAETLADNQTIEYVNAVKAELLPLGYTVVPLYPS